MKITPIEDRVLIKPAEAEEKTASGIYLPEAAKEKPMQGKVVALGPGKLNDDGSRTVPTVKKGDTVLYGKWSGTEVKMDGKEYVILKESDILGVEG